MSKVSIVSKISGFIKAQPILSASFVAALITVFIIPPDEQYIGYCNFAVLCELFGLMTAVAGLTGAGIFERLTAFLLKKAGDERRLSFILVMICFLSSMLVTNDVALITFVPLTLLAFSRSSDKRGLIICIVLETAAANLGSMLTPIGNPQNLYIYDRFGLTPLEFVQALLPGGAVGFVCLMLLLLLIPKTPCEAQSNGEKKVSAKLAAVYGVLFTVCAACVFKLLPYYVCAAAAVITALILDRRLLLKVDHCLLLTFIFFFIFVGNISRIDAVHDFLERILTGNEITVSALLSQVISNVPAAVMLSGFTENGTALLIGVDIGGFGTPIASMASLISLQLYRKEPDAKTGKFMLFFSAVNFGLLILLLIMYLLILR